MKLWRCEKVHDWSIIEKFDYITWKKSVSWLKKINVFWSKLERVFVFVLMLVLVSKAIKLAQCRRPWLQPEGWRLAGARPVATLFSVSASVRDTAPVRDTTACLCLSHRYYSVSLPQRYCSVSLPQTEIGLLQHVSDSARDTTACLCLSQRYYSVSLPQSEILQRVSASVTDTTACLCLRDTTACLCLSHRYYSASLPQRYYSVSLPQSQIL